MNAKLTNKVAAVCNVTGNITIITKMPYCELEFKTLGNKTEKTNLYLS